MIYASLSYPTWNREHSEKKNLTIHQIIEGVRAKELKVTLLFIDFSKVFDSIRRGEMEQILLAYGLSKETVINIMMLHENTKAMICSSDDNIDFFNIITGFLQGDSLLLYMFIISKDNVLQMSIKEKWFYNENTKSRKYPA